MRYCLSRTVSISKHMIRQLLFILCFSLAFTSAQAAITGPCSGCHTMHNSQDGQPMNFDSSATPNDMLLMGDCIDCHATNRNVAIWYPNGGVDGIPQVLHDNATDLAGGNFGYLDGTKSPPAGIDSRGHNITALTGAEDILFAPPGQILNTGHDDGTWVNRNNLTCSAPAGSRGGCHGNRWATPSVAGYSGILGSHHNNLSGSLNPADTDIDAGHSYRFLLGVKGYEDTDWQFTTATHNEYYALATPVQLNGCGAGTISCHGDGGIRPPDGTISQFCATCHGNFHTLAVQIGGGDPMQGVGPNAISPFVRHPTDLSLPGTGEYTDYTLYDLDAPIARTVLPTQSENNANNAAVMCLSCHLSHASEFPDMLRWNYSSMEIGVGVGNNGCFACHTEKD